MQMDFQSSVMDEGKFSVPEGVIKTQGNIIWHDNNGLHTMYFLCQTPGHYGCSCTKKMYKS